jgi:hypothetical protein
MLSAGIGFFKSGGRAVISKASCEEKFNCKKKRSREEMLPRLKIPARTKSVSSLASLWLSQKCEPRNTRSRLRITRNRIHVRFSCISWSWFASQLIGARRKPQTDALPPANEFYLVFNSRVGSTLVRFGM